MRRARETWSAHSTRYDYRTIKDGVDLQRVHPRLCSINIVISAAHTAQIIDESTGPHTISRRIPMTRDIRWSRMVLSRPDLAARRHVTLGLVGRSNYPYPMCNQHGLRDAQLISRTTVVNAVCPLPTRHQACTFSGTPIPGIDAIRNPSPQRQNMRRPSACESSQHAEHATHKSIAASLCSLLMLARCQKARLEGDGGVASPSPRSSLALHPLDPPRYPHMAGGRYAHAQPHGIMCWAAASRRDRRVAVDGLGGGHDGGIKRCPREKKRTVRSG